MSKDRSSTEGRLKRKTTAEKISRATKIITSTEDVGAIPAHLDVLKNIGDRDIAGLNALLQVLSKETNAKVREGMGQYIDTKMFNLVDRLSGSKESEPLTTMDIENLRLLVRLDNRAEALMMRVGELDTLEEKNNLLGQLLSNNVLSFEKDQENLEEGFDNLSSIQMLFATTEYLTSKNEREREQALDKIVALSGDNSSRQVLINELKKGKYSDKYSQIEKIFDKGIVQDSELVDLMTHYALNAYQWGMLPEATIRERLIGIAQSDPERSNVISKMLKAHDETVSKNREPSLGQKIKENWFAPFVGVGLKSEEASRWAAFTDNIFDSMHGDNPSARETLISLGSQMKMWKVDVTNGKITDVNWFRAANPFQLLNFGLKAVDLGVQRLAQSAFGWNKVVRGIVQAPFVLVTRVPQAIINIPAQLISLPLEKLSDYRSEKKAELEALGDLKSSSATDIDLAIESINSFLETPGTADALSSESESPRLGSDSDTASLESPRSDVSSDEEAPLLREGETAVSVDSSAVQEAEDAASLGLLNRVGNRVKKAWTDFTGRFQNRTQGLEEDDNLIASEFGSVELDDLSESDDTYDATVLNPEDLAEVGERLSDPQSGNPMPSAGEGIAEVSDDFLRSDGEPIPELFRDSDFESIEEVVKEEGDRVILVGFMAEGKRAETLENLKTWFDQNKNEFGPGKTLSEEKTTTYNQGQSVQQVGDDIVFKGFNHDDSRRLIQYFLASGKEKKATQAANIQPGEQQATQPENRQGRERSDTVAPGLDTSFLQPEPESPEEQNLGEQNLGEQNLGSATAEAESDALTEKFSIAKMFSNIRLRFTGKKAEAAPSETLGESDPVVVAKAPEVETAVAETEKTGGTVVKAEYNEVRLIGFAEVLESESAQSKTQSKLQGWVDKMEETLGKPAGKVGEYPIEFPGGQRVEVRGKDLVLRGFSEDAYDGLKKVKNLFSKSQNYTVSGADAASYQRAADGMGNRGEKKDLSSRLSSARLFLEKTWNKVSTAFKGFISDMGLSGAKITTTTLEASKQPPSEFVSETPGVKQDTPPPFNSEATFGTKVEARPVSSDSSPSGPTKPSTQPESLSQGVEHSGTLEPKVDLKTPQSPPPPKPAKPNQLPKKPKGVGHGPAVSWVRVKVTIPQHSESESLKQTCEAYRENGNISSVRYEGKNDQDFKAILTDAEGGEIAVSATNSNQQVVVEELKSSSTSMQNMANIVSAIPPAGEKAYEVSGPKERKESFNDHYKAVNQSAKTSELASPRISQSD